MENFGNEASKIGISWSKLIKNSFINIKLTDENGAIVRYGAFNSFVSATDVIDEQNRLTDLGEDFLHRFKGKIFRFTSGIQLSCLFHLDKYYENCIRISWCSQKIRLSAQDILNCFSFHSCLPVKAIYFEPDVADIDLDPETFISLPFWWEMATLKNYRKRNIISVFPTSVETFYFPSNLHAIAQSFISYFGTDRVKFYNPH